MPNKRWKDINNKIKNPDSNVRKAYNFFIEKGYTPAQSAGIVGNLAQESSVSLNSNVENSIGAFGIAQWLGPRRKNLEKFAKERNIPSNDFDLQLEFILHELNTTEKRANKSLLIAGTPSEAAASFVKRFERSGEKPGDRGFDRRINFADLFYNTFTDEKGSISNKDTETESNVNPLSVPTDSKEMDFMQEVIRAVDNLKTQAVTDKEADIVKKQLQDKINQRNFIADFIQNTGVEFVERKPISNIQR